MGDYEMEGRSGFLSPATLFLVLILLLTGTLGGYGGCKDDYK